MFTAYADQAIFLGNNKRLLITFSLGVLLFKKDEEQAALLNRADQTMHLAKKLGENRVVTETDLVAIKKRIKYLV